MGKTISPSEIDNYIIKMIVAKYKQLQEDLPRYLEQFIYSEFYDKFEPEMYERQYRIINAIMVSNIKMSGKTISMEIYLDPSKVSYDPAKWKNPITGTVSSIPGDTVEDVWDLMRSGIHGQESIAVTDGDFWQSFVDSVNHGGIYDLFVDFKKYLSSTAGLTIK
ncbi:hypothetical protein SAMN05443270_3012 [Lacrimispora sphenoides]|uniref:hypothetical protein n=1 Tax=Lacrimispora sphenoides TaxID=29370 RepID=UPI0008AAB91B|nr:hypothetical protein [Lacrimispora sphenoides]SEU08265.1 hypothetical protein SAMN05443270_3012 [Lacrimispora sphenoides]